MTYQFTASNILASPADKITLAIPSFSASTVTTITPVPYASAGCGSSPTTATFTGAVSNGGAATATIALTVASNNVPATTCTVRIPCSAVPNHAQPANYCTRTVALTIASFADMPATTISNSPAISGTQSIASTASVLTITTPVVSEASSVAYAFTAGAAIATNDVISIGLPSFTGSTFVSVAEGNTCGTATFSGKFTGSGATAALEVSVATNNVPATTACTLTAASGLTTPSASQAANLNTRTLTITSYPVGRRVVFCKALGRTGCMGTGAGMWEWHTTMDGPLHTTRIVTAWTGQCSVEQTRRSVHTTTARWWRRTNRIMQGTRMW